MHIEPIFVIMNVAKFHISNLKFGGIVMKKFKSLIASGLVTATALCSVPFMSVSAAKAASAEPKIYLDITVDEIGFRADVIFENVPEVTSVAVGFRLGKSWQPVMKDVLTAKSIEGTSSNMGHLVCWGYAKDDYNFTLLSADCDSGVSVNGVFASFYIEKTDDFNILNSAINLYDGDKIHIDITTAEGTDIFGNVNSSSPVMLEANEFIYGDTYNDGRPDATDASRVLRICGDEDGYINRDDAQAILRYYTLMISKMPYDGIIGTKDVYEVYR